MYSLCKWTHCSKLKEKSDKAPQSSWKWNECELLNCINYCCTVNQNNIGTQTNVNKTIILTAKKHLHTTLIYIFIIWMIWKVNFRNIKEGLWHLEPRGFLGKKLPRCEHSDFVAPESLSKEHVNNSSAPRFPH